MGDQAQQRRASDEELLASAGEKARRLARQLREDATELADTPAADALLDTAQSAEALADLLNAREDRERHDPARR